jgi:hypothetical protein
MVLKRLATGHMHGKSHARAGFGGQRAVSKQSWGKDPIRNAVKGWLKMDVPGGGYG